MSMSTEIPLHRLLGGLEPSARYVHCDPNTCVAGLEVDSRRVDSNVAFLALRGATHDGHDFVDTVLEAGARVVIVEHGRIEAPPGPHVWLSDTNAAYPAIAANAFGHPAQALRCAGVTGTNGKTTTAHLVGAMLRAAERPHLRLGSTGNWMIDAERPASFTTPFPLELQALLRDAVDRGATDLVMEVSSHALEQGRIRPLRFATVGFTSFSQDHLDFHGDMSTYLAAKCRLASQHLQPGGVAVAAVDGQPGATQFLDAARVVGARVWRASKQDAAAEIQASEVQLRADGITARLVTPAGEANLRSPLVGSFNLDNLMVAAGLGLGLGIGLPTIVEALATARGAPGRLEHVALEGGAGPRVIVDFAHTPDAIERALAVLRELTPGRLVVALGCGGDRDRSKRPMMGAVAARDADLFYATSDNPRTEDPARILDDMLAGVAPEYASRVVRELDRSAAIARAIADAAPDDVVLIAGKGHEDYQILGTRKIHFDDREHARAALVRRSP
jgi:UDP-N-acetylmuramoyl-L-alanyl-D-glutamate--2,6-diaminopimelate ligase